MKKGMSRLVAYGMNIETKIVTKIDCKTKLGYYNNEVRVTNKGNQIKVTETPDGKIYSFK